jgi:hypothetical protein
VYDLINFSLIVSIIQIGFGIKNNLFYDRNLNLLVVLMKTLEQGYVVAKYTL